MTRYDIDWEFHKDEIIRRYVQEKKIAKEVAAWLTSTPNKRVK
jgi:hypothetical protein